MQGLTIARWNPKPCWLWVFLLYILYVCISMLWLAMRWFSGVYSLCKDMFPHYKLHGTLHNIYSTCMNCLLQHTVDGRKIDGLSYYKASTIQGGAGFVPFRVFIHQNPARGRPLSSCGWIQQRGKSWRYGLGDLSGKTLAIPWNNVIGWVSYCINNYFGPFRQCLLPSWCFVKCWYLGLTIIHCRSQYFWRFVF